MLWLVTHGLHGVYYDILSLHTHMFVCCDQQYYSLGKCQTKCNITCVCIAKCSVELFIIMLTKMNYYTALIIINKR
jgi:hypothetical protein